MVLTALVGGAASADSVTVTADRLNMRKEADASSKSIAVVEKEDALSFVSENGDWYQVKSGGKTGFVMKEYVELDKTQLAADVEANTEAMTGSGRTTDRVNMRKMPMTGTDIVKVIPKNGSVEIVGQCGEWYQVRYGGKTGYLMAQYLTLETERGSADSGESASEELYAAAKSGTASVRVNMRKEAGTSSDIVKVIAKGASISVLGETGGWYKVSAGGKEGYISKSYVTMDSAAGDASSGSDEVKLYDEAVSGQTTDRVNMRKEASTGASIAKVIAKGGSVSVLGETGSWYKVSAGGREGYIAKAYISLEGDQAASGESTDAVVPEDFVSYPAARTGSVTARVNMRESASTGASVAKVLNANTSVTVLGEQGGFYQVKYGDAIGYIAKSYVVLGTTGESTDDNTTDDNTTEDTGSIAGETLYTATKAAVTTVKVNMRREPEGDVLFTLPEGTGVTLIGETGSWYKAIYSSSTGYISKAYVTEKAETVAPNEPEDDEVTTDTTPDMSGEGMTAYITAQTLNMRKGAGTGYGVIKVLSYGEEIKYYSLENGWYLVKAGEDTGYVSSKYVSTTKPDVAPSNPSDEAEDTTEVGKVQMADWWTSDIQKIFKVGVIATVTDVDTGLSWQVKRSGGTNHADVQPLTAEDTAKMKQAYGGTWSWNRRAIWVTIDGVSYAASMNGMPHGTGSITTNNFDGHHCIHFLNSRTHTGNRWDTAHQSMVQKAYKAGQ